MTTLPLCACEIPLQVMLVYLSLEVTLISFLATDPLERPFDMCTCLESDQKWVSALRSSSALRSHSPSTPHHHVLEELLVSLFHKEPKRASLIRLSVLL